MDVKRLPLRRRDGSIRAYALVDEDDYAAVSGVRWSLTGNGYVSSGGAAGDLLHRLLLGLRPGDGLQGDHINRDRLDNRRANLRVLSQPENLQNLSLRGGSSRHRGVSWDKQCKRWRAYGFLAGTKHHLGSFVDEEVAAAAARDFREMYMAGAVD